MDKKKKDAHTIGGCVRVHKKMLVEKRKESRKIIRVSRSLELECIIEQKMALYKTFLQKKHKQNKLLYNSLT